VSGPGQNPDVGRRKTRADPAPAHGGGADGVGTRRRVRGLFGIAGGYLLGAMFQRAALRTGLLDATVPAGQLLLTLVALAAVGVAAAAWPAWRATKINVLAAIVTE
jgi:hypothetical protein